MALDGRLYLFTWHWRITHAKILYGSCWGVDINESPLPWAAAALPLIPRIVPDKPEGHNPLICGSHHLCIGQLYYRALPPQLSTS